MKAAYIKTTTGYDSIRYGEFPEPNVGAHEVLIQVEACSVNVVDTLICQGIYQTPMTFPAVLGRDAIGVILAVGSAVTKFKVGERVWTNSMGYANRQGVTAERIAVPENRLFLAPENVDPRALIASVHPAATAEIVLDSVMNLQPGETLLVEGAAGHVGKRLVELANERGATALTTSAPHDFEKLQQLGATHCFDYHDENLKAHIQQVVPTKMDHIIDTSGKVALQANLDLLAVGGQITMITAPSETTFAGLDFYTSDQVIQGFVISRASLEQIMAAGEKINAYFAQGKLLETEITVRPLSEIQQAYQQVKTTKERMVLVPE
ncbi:MAG: zinc-binding dehydrogenase [Aerococcus sp.]|nr:zinc-binding dehydrogenase [Aerococcus sp.]